MSDTLGLATELQAVTGKGLTLYYGLNGDVNTATWYKVEGTNSVPIPSPAKTDIDVTTTEDDVKKSISGLADMADMSVDCNYYPNNSVHRYIVGTLAYDDTNIPWKIVGPHFACYFNGHIKTVTSSGTPDAKMTMNLTLKVSSKPQFVYADDVKAVITYNSTLAGDESTGAVTGSVVATFAPNSGVSATFATGVTGEFTAGTHYTISGVPTGLTAVLTKTSGTVATLTFTGTASNVTDVTNISLAFLDAAFTGVTAAQTTGSSKSNIAITFA